MHGIIGHPSLAEPAGGSGINPNAVVDTLADPAEESPALPSKRNNLAPPARAMGTACVASRQSLPPPESLNYHYRG